MCINKTCIITMYYCHTGVLGGPTDRLSRLHLTIRASMGAGAAARAPPEASRGALTPAVARAATTRTRLRRPSGTS